MINIIVAYNQNRVIGIKGNMPWHLTQDMHRFKELTFGHSIIMGRKTHESIGRALSGRKNIIISRNKDYIPLGPFDQPIFVVQSLERALEVAKSDGNDIFIIGGEEIYRESMHLANRIYATLVKNTMEGDTYFPEIPEIEKWHIVEEIKNNGYDFITFERL